MRLEHVEALNRLKTKESVVILSEEKSLVMITEALRKKIRDLSLPLKMTDAKTV
jgi:hypothetical protein